MKNKLYNSGVVGLFVNSFSCYLTLFFKCFKWSIRLGLFVNLFETSLFKFAISFNNIGYLLFFNKIYLSIL